MSAYFYYAALHTCSPYFPVQKQTLNIKNMDFLLFILEGPIETEQKGSKPLTLFVFNLQLQQVE